MFFGKLIPHVNSRIKILNYQQKATRIKRESIRDAGLRDKQLYPKSTQVIRVGCKYAHVIGPIDRIRQSKHNYFVALNTHIHICLCVCVCGHKVFKTTISLTFLSHTHKHAHRSRQHYVCFYVEYFSFFVNEIQKERKKKIHTKKKLSPWGFYVRLCVCVCAGGVTSGCCCENYAND